MQESSEPANWRVMVQTVRTTCPGIALPLHLNCDRLLHVVMCAVADTGARATNYRQHLDYGLIRCQVKPPCGVEARVMRLFQLDQLGT